MGLIESLNAHRLRELREKVVYVRGVNRPTP
jgi:hypothetical protein